MAYGILKVDNITFDNGGSDQNVTVSGLYRATTSGVTLSGTIAATTVSGVTVIGSTTVSGATVTGTTANFTSGNFSNIISSAATMSGALIMANQQQVRFREAVGNGVNHIALQAPAIVSADQTITLPDQTGTVITTGDNGSVSSTMLATNLTISAAAGSASTPSIAFTGDPNTGIYSPGADQVAVSTGGTGRLFVDSSGKVGIGVGSPGATFDLAAGAGASVTAVLIRSVAANANGFQIVTDSTTDNVYLNNFYNAALRFGTNNTERLRIDSSGRVGIGTSSPGVALDVVGGISGNAFNATNTPALFGSSGGAVLYYNGAGVGVVRAYSNAAGAAGALTFNASGSENVRIDSSGRVGVGTSAPEARLDISPGVADTIYLTAPITSGAVSRNIGLFTPAGGSKDSSIDFGYIDRSNNFASTLTFRTSLDNSSRNVARMHIDSSGRVGIGTSAPAARLDVTGPANSLQARFGNVAGRGLEISTAIAVGTDDAATILNVKGATSGTLIFQTDSNERLRIDSSGRVGIGMSTPSSELDVNNGVITAGQSGAVLRGRFSSAFPSTGGGYFQLSTNNTDGFNGGLSIFTLASSTLTERLRIDSSGRVGIGTSSPGVNLDVASTTPTVRVNATGGGTPSLSLFSSGVYDWLVQGGTALKIVQDATERARIDSSGRLLVGTSTARSNFYNTSFANSLQIEGVDSSTTTLSLTSNNSSTVGQEGTLVFAKSNGGSSGSNVLVSTGTPLGRLSFQGSDGSEFVEAASIQGFVDGTPGANDMPGRLVFSTTADGAASPTERLRITSTGVFQIGDASDITVGTTTGTKIGTATTQKLGFYNATPVVQPTAVADATDAASVITQLNALLTRMRNLGLIAT